MKRPAKILLAESRVMRAGLAMERFSKRRPYYYAASAAIVAVPLFIFPPLALAVSPFAILGAGYDLRTELDTAEEHLADLEDVYESKT